MKKLEDVLIRALMFEAAKQASRSHLQFREPPPYSSRKMKLLINEVATQKRLEILEEKFHRIKRTTKCLLKLWSIGEFQNTLL